MKNKFSFFLIGLTFFSFLTIAITGCKKEEVVIADKQVAFFIGTGVGNYTITAPSQTYKVYVGLTKASSSDRTVNVAVSSPTGATAGTHYSLSSNAVTFKAGSVIDSITVTAVYSAYVGGRKDTLSFAFANADDGVVSLNNSYKLLVRGPCFEGEAQLNAFKFTFPQTNELFGTSAYGPYTTTISAVTPLTATTGKITVTNIWDFGWGPIDFILDWTDPANRTVTVVPATSGIADGSTISATYAGKQVLVRPYAGQPGTFSFCAGTIVLKMQLGIEGVGYFTSLYTVTPGK